MPQISDTDVIWSLVISSAQIRHKSGNGGAGGGAPHACQESPVKLYCDTARELKPARI